MFVVGAGGRVRGGRRLSRATRPHSFQTYSSSASSPPQRFAALSFAAHLLPDRARLAVERLLDSYGEHCDARRAELRAKCRRDRLVSDKRRLHRVHADATACHDEQPTDARRANGLKFAVAVRMILISRTPRETKRPQRDAVAKQVAQRVDAVGDECRRVGRDAGNALERCEAHIGHRAHLGDLVSAAKEQGVGSVSQRRCILTSRRLQSAFATVGQVGISAAPFEGLLLVLGCRVGMSCADATRSEWRDAPHEPSKLRWRATPPRTHCSEHGCARGASHPGRAWVRVEYTYSLGRLD